MSALNVINYEGLPPWLIYPFQVLNLFELAYWFTLSYLIGKELKDNMSNGFLIIASSYGVCLLIWIVGVSKQFNNRIIDYLYSSLLHLPKPFFDTRKIGELVARLNDTGRIQRVVSHVVGGTIIEILTSYVLCIFTLQKLCT